MKCPHCGHELAPRAPKGAWPLDRPLAANWRRGWAAESFTATWADGSSTYVSGVIFEKPAMRWAAAFQAANRLRRYRAARMKRAAWTLEGTLPRGADMRGAGGPTPEGVWLIQDSYDWTAWLYAAPMSPLSAIVAENGETYTPDAPHYGGGDQARADELWARMVDAPEVRRAA